MQSGLVTPLDGQGDLPSSEIKYRSGARILLWWLDVDHMSQVCIIIIAILALRSSPCEIIENIGNN